MTDRLSIKQLAVLSALRKLDMRAREQRDLSGWWLAYDVAQEAEVDNRAVGAVLASLRRRGLAAREHDASERVYRWRLA